VSAASASIAQPSHIVRYKFIKLNEYVTIQSGTYLWQIFITKIKADVIFWVKEIILTNSNNVYLSLIKK